MYNLIIGVVLLGAGTLFVTSDLGQPILDKISNYMFPTLTAGCDTNSVNSIMGLAYALDCTGMAHAGIDVRDICPPQKMFGNKVVACYGEGDNYQCEVQGFELTKDPEYDQPEPWIVGMGDPNCLVYYEAFPEEQAADWKVRVQDFDIVAIFVGGAINVATAGTAAGIKAPFRILKGIPKGASVIKNLVKKIASISLKGTKKLMIKKFRNVLKATDNEASHVLKRFGKTLQPADRDGLNDVVSDKTFEYVMKKDVSTGKQFKKEVMDAIETRLPNKFTSSEKKYFAENMDSYVRFINGKSVKGQISDIQKMRYWNIYGDLMLNQGTPWTKEVMEAQIKKSMKIYKNVPTSQKEMMLVRAKAVGEFYMNPKVMDSSTFKLFAVDLADDLDDSFISSNPDYSEELNAMATCPIMVGSSGGLAPRAMGTLSCALIVSLGLMAAYVDNDNEKYEPVGINALGYKKNYYGVDTEKLADVVNFYYVALKRDDSQQPRRFFLASPCRTEKVTVKHEKISCYYSECHVETVCCEKKIRNIDGDWVHDEYIWADKKECITEAEDWTEGIVHNTGEVIKRGFLYSVPGMGFVVLYAETQDGQITLNGQDIQIFGELRHAAPSGSYDVEHPNIVCENAGIGSQTTNHCFGAYAATRNKLLDVSLKTWLSNPSPVQQASVIGTNVGTVDRFFFTKYPIILTLGNSKMTDENPNIFKPSEDWNSNVEIKSPTYFYSDPTFQTLEPNINKQAETGLLNNNVVNTHIVPTYLYMDASGNGIKQCIQSYERTETYFNPWAQDMKEDVDALTVDVELDYSFEGNNYCYAGSDWGATAAKGVIMLGLVAIDLVATTASLGLATPVVLFVTGSAYETAAHFIDKASAWPHR